jgi:hypothetical protein
LYALLVLRFIVGSLGLVFWVLLRCFVFGFCLGPMYTFCVLRGARAFFDIYNLLIKKKLSFLPLCHAKGN